MTDVRERAIRSRFVPGQPDMWAFVLFEALIFTGYFCVYLFNRAQRPDDFLPFQAALDVRVGVLNTVVLLLSSWSIARCVAAARAERYRTALVSAGLTALFGAMFFVIKVSEWVHNIGADNGVTSNEFFTYYFFLTGIHCLHLLIGFVVLGVVIYQLRGPARRSQELIETGATYWHTVDLLWVLIFALLYVVR
ncbi:cytochrome c oxidase subunit 3 family protein [Mycolicibacterium fluoranthenivorans]|uniref:Probable cytochrome c oxidase subunit 3 n=1 Tax=Mycolicibacterium fluoranthenivorans TaxID=258505 RepID=A0A1G4WX20_9MYCO|nr:cytochrome c oxidase subunit 3 [Mycolicibacterium fluoranthenivorans]QNJ94828.1 cytochrome c oxidase subunit 3 family protein [Mycolicibacterium fluoranthenivorans]SCX31443.1 nitric oxide reductase NorE protein [Mycolicibacterium fluoranthenivorans]